MGQFAFFHRHAEERVAPFHGTFAVSDHHKLRAFGKFAKIIGKVVDIGFISAASISSRMQKGVGRSLSIAKGWR